MPKNRINPRGAKWKAARKKRRIPPYRYVAVHPIYGLVSILHGRLYSRARMDKSPLTWRLAFNGRRRKVATPYVGYDTERRRFIIGDGTRFRHQRWSGFDCFKYRYGWRGKVFGPVKQDFRSAYGS